MVKASSAIYRDMIYDYFRWSPDNDKNLDLEGIRENILKYFEKVESDYTLDDLETDEGISGIWDMLVEEDDHWDIMTEYRASGEDVPGVSCERSRHYESDAVGCQMRHDGKWVSWTYWYGGGKHGYPDDIDWISDAKYIELVSEEEIKVIKRTFAEIKEI